LESDSDDEKGRDYPGDGDDGTGTATTAKEPAYAPPRRMELTNLPGLHDRGGLMDDDGGRARPTHFITKLPNLVAINSAAYDASSHDMEREEGQYRGYVHNMIRWRYKTDGAGVIVRDEGGEPRRESNTRVVKWSDGSYTLHVGKEVLEVDNVDGGVPADHPDSSMAGFPGINGYLYVSQKARIRPPSRKALERGGPPTEGEEEEEEEEDDDDDDAPCQPAGTVLECVAPIVSRLVPRPSSLASEAHRNQALAVRQRNVKRARIAEIVTEVDPEKEKLARIKGKDDLAKSRARGGGGGGGGGGRRSGGGGGGRRRGMNAGYLEDDDDYDGVNIGRLKKNTMRRDRSDGEEEMDYGDDDDSEEDDEGWMSKKKKTRGAAAARAAGAKAPTKSHKSYSESSDEGEVVFGDDDDDDDDDGAAFVKKRGGGGSGTKKTVFSDDDDD
jgi:RNA polymerase-associated protein LEO1